MAQPIWITSTGSLGTIPEGVFFSTPVVATASAQTVYYSLVAGQLPPGMALSTAGVIAGVPLNVSLDTTSRFCIRAYTTTTVGGQTVIDRFNDRTFSLTVAEQNIPTFLTPSGSIGTINEAEYYQFQILYSDNTNNAVLELVAGSLPPGLSVTSTGLIKGFVEPIPDSTQTFLFSLALASGSASNVREFSITVETTAIIKPYIENFLPSALGSYPGDSFFAYQFIGQDFESEPIEYIEYNGPGLAFPPGLTLNSSTGWLSGTIPVIGTTEITYNFAIQVQRVGLPATLSDPYYFSVTITGSLSSQVTWLTQENLGTIVTGDTSIFNIRAVSQSNLTLFYRLKSNNYPTVNLGYYNRLPQGLKLLPSGNIAGRVSFNTFSLDNGTTTFDVSPVNRPRTTPTTFDLTCRFTVNAYSLDGVVNATKEFTILIDRQYNEPYQNLYITAMPPLDDRALLDEILSNTDVFVPEALYRPDDPNFGLATSIQYFHAYGLTASSVDEYLASMDLNHYWKNLLLGPVQTAQALDNNGDVIYEVVYSQILDNLVNDQGQSVSKSLTLPYKIDSYDYVTMNSEITGTLNDISTVYPNSLINMRDQVIDVIGKISDYLPKWMTSEQEDGQVLGFIPAWVLCYTKPNQSKRIKYYFDNEYSDTLNKIDFKADRYELDRLLSKNWDPIADSTVGSWEPSPPLSTSFDLDWHYRITSIANAGTGYAISDTILILGSNLGGLDGINDVIVTVLDVGASGDITYLSVTGTAPLLSSGDTYSGVTGTTDGSGINAEFDFVVASGDATIFDDNSMRFESPVDNYTDTDEFNKYLLFPKRNILV
jgi:hypothetical protein